jgi:hypothetical protein
MAGPPLMPSYVSQLRYTQDIYNIAALAGISRWAWIRDLGRGGTLL